MTKGVAGMLLLLWATGLAAEPQQAVPDSLRIEDADTLLVDVAGIAYRIQLRGIDAPENTRNPKLQRDSQRTGLDAESLLELGHRADQGLATLLSEFTPYTLHFDPERRDKYGRVPGDLVDADGRWLSVRLVERGYAIPLSGADAAQQVELDAALAASRAAGRGLWGSHAERFAAWAQPATATPVR